VVDFAEIPTLQRKSEPPPSCAELVVAVAVSVAGERLAWTVDRSDFAYQDGDVLVVGAVVSTRAATTLL
jgi:hypothetical protein